ncbi:MAG TPA: glycosyltransferase family 4 protein [bacterium]|nr:glycosyltransferase family 4 protein [bacterium]
MKTNNAQRPKILFIAYANSSHTHSWISTIAGSAFEVSLFAVSGTAGPEASRCPIYMFRAPAVPRGGLWNDIRSGLVRVFWKMAMRVLGGDRLVSLLIVFGHRTQFSASLREIENMEYFWLIRTIKDMRPDIIHTLAIEPSGFLFHRLREQVAGYYGKWMLTARGRELTLKGYLPEEKVKEVLSFCDMAIVDSRHSKEIAERYCRSVMQFPGTGGIDIPEQIVEKRERMILFPKAHEFWGSKSLPVLEALALCWQEIKPCTIHMAAVDRETRESVGRLPEDMRFSIVMHDRMPREELFDLMTRTRVLLAPSLSDGIPNVLYEAMAYGALPVVSPLETIREVAEDGKNCLFARNLYPEEIAKVVVRAMNDDELFVHIQRNNREKVMAVADRKEIAKEINRLYEEMPDV